MKFGHKFLYRPSPKRGDQAVPAPTILRDDDIECDREVLRTKAADVFNTVTALLAYSGADGMALLQFRAEGPLHRIVVGSAEDLPVLLEAATQPKAALQANVTTIDPLTFIDRDGRTARVADAVTAAISGLSGSLDYARQIGQTDLFGEVITVQGARASLLQRMREIGRGLVRLADHMAPADQQGAAAETEPLQAALATIVANAKFQPDASTGGATDCYAVPLDDIDSARKLIADHSKGEPA
jgi:hypothetical protein